MIDVKIAIVIQMIWMLVPASFTIFTMMLAGIFQNFLFGCFCPEDKEDKCCKDKWVEKEFSDNEDEHDHMVNIEWIKQAKIGDKMRVKFQKEA
jgi:hypothetical protein